MTPAEAVDIVTRHADSFMEHWSTDDGMNKDEHDIYRECQREYDAAKRILEAIVS